MFSFVTYQKLGFKSLWKGIARTPESGAPEHQVGNPWSEGYYDVTRSGVTRCASWQTSGFFVEVNAGDGEYKSQSLFFEVQRNWTGLLVEPDPAPFSEMKTKNRKAFSINACVSLLPKCTNKTLAWVYYYIYTATLWFYKMHYGIRTQIEYMLERSTWRCFDVIFKVCSTVECAFEIPFLEDHSENSLTVF